VDPETQGPVPTLQAHFPIQADRGWLCSCGLPEAFITKTGWAQHTISHLWPVMQEEPF
jgi:hypothetical protein